MPNNNPSKKTVLLIEDNNDTRNLYKDVFEENGFKVDTAQNGNEGLTQAERGGYDAILLDIMIPELDGLAILSSLKKNPPKSKNGPIILLSNLSDENIIKQGIASGAKDYIVKSDMNPGQVVEKVKSILNPS